MHDICNLFGVALNRARHELGLTQVELAEKLGTTDRSISLRARKDQSKAGYPALLCSLQAAGAIPQARWEIDVSSWRLSS